MIRQDVDAAKWNELWHLYAALKEHGEKETANVLDEANWTQLVENYPDLTAEEIAFAVCGGVS